MWTKEEFQRFGELAWIKDFVGYRRFNRLGSRYRPCLPRMNTEDDVTNCPRNADKQKDTEEVLSFLGQPAFGRLVHANNPL
ncbi:hypothetical protein N7516_008386 [Penicillium verrucosum]|uniref:uncharacterized protein n=1 Tax=Penicillium verrucosum TaxID=60171 RepID=UPI002544EF4E|nr:uncharacterized protein N7516_008386 [Penicillium verrucosum]KAJ5926613.1 hypothetical protein N7516_008386 [Penicillium verrucosum]